MLADDLLLTPAELERLTGYRRGHEQLEELHRQGFFRARRNRLGEIVLERAHYDAVAAGGASRAEPEAPTFQLRPPRLRSV